MAQNPVDLGKDFVERGMRLITHRSSESLLKKSQEQKYKIPEDRYSRPCGGSHGFDDYVERWHE